MIGTTQVTPTASPAAMPQSFVPSTKHAIAANRLTARLGILLLLMLLFLVAAASLVVQAGTAAPDEHSSANFSVSAGPVLGVLPVPTAPPVVMGNVTYRTSSTKIAGVTISLAGMGSMQVPTDASGNYTVTIFADGLHTITPSLSGQVNNISSFDAAYIAQCVIALRPMSDCPLLAADTTGNNQLSSFDAAQIAQYLVGLADANNRVGRWVFDPTSRSYNAGTTNLYNENFASYLVGEVSGNWQPSAARPGPQTNGQPLTPPLTAATTDGAAAQPESNAPASETGARPYIAYLPLLSK